MEVRLLRSFVAIAEEGTITKAAELLHVTQPALSRQLALLEDELGVQLFVRQKHRLTLTDDGILLKRRAQEILQLVDLTERELQAPTDELEGSISLGLGELSSSNILLDATCAFAAQNPKVKFSYLVAVTDQITERLDRGLLDFGLLLEPVDTQKYAHIRLPHKERWVAAMAPDHPLAAKTVLEPKDLVGYPLIFPSRANVQSSLAKWFGRYFDKLDVRYTVSLGTLRLGMVSRNMGINICVQGSTTYWDPSLFSTVPLANSPEVETLLAWKRDVPHSRAVDAFIRYIEQRY